MRTIGTRAALAAAFTIAVASTAPALAQTDTGKPTASATKGAIAGGVAGHMMGHHTKTGVVAGAMIGHHMRKKQMAKSAG